MVNDNPTKIVAYYRVSTKRQGKSGLGLEAQRKLVEDYARTCNGVIIESFREVESGRKCRRVELDRAIKHSKLTGATLIIAKLDRLSRDVEFIFKLKNSEVNFQALDVPIMNTLNVGIQAVIAQHEREIISKRIKEALAAKRARGESLGRPENFSNEGRAKGRANRRYKAVHNEKNRLLYETIAAKRRSSESYRQIANHLNDKGFQTVRGGKFHATTVQRIFKMFQNSNLQGFTSA